MSRPLLQLYRYGLVGVAINLTLYGVYWLITYWGIEPKKAMTFLYIAGVLIGFAGHRKWTFAHNGDWVGALVRFVVAHLLGYSINLVMLLVLADRLGYSHQWVQATAIFVVAGFLFAAFRYFVFPEAVGGVRVIE